MEINKEELENKLASILSKSNLTEKRKEITEMEEQSQAPDFWTDSKSAAVIMKKINDNKKVIDEIEMMQLLFEEGELEEAKKLIEKYEILLFLSGPYDKGDVIFSIHAGQGGTEAMDWTNMLFRMYTRYCERKGFSYEEIDRVPGDEAGIKSTIININGSFAYGYLKCEAGVHRLVRQSPFNADKLRQTSFALVEV
ncbi:MAG: Peptide chain release factor 2, partial [Candidatus Roizmanbacteria bacterium GW2011_GWA2_35_19]